MEAVDRDFWTAGWWTRQDQQRTRTTMMAAFGLSASATLPAGGMPEIVLRGVRVKIVPRLYVKNQSARKPHRILATCPDCGMEVSAGRMHQHLGTAFCKLGRGKQADE